MDHNGGYKIELMKFAISEQYAWEPPLPEKISVRSISSTCVMFKQLILIHYISSFTLLCYYVIMM